ncbi:MAG: 50S ribosomal protein L4 [Candidatus Taylorbacteria bacterium RIFCSPHIGHO2_02_FULL_47_18]|uniref:Large ribosomal subunit protein uL4 n=1 Tax=Candidatus Taylorbacteria bacterium RIFCSPLOWO2_01_FULL_48_100 TaxID=1802322 RepID=A0A1G2NGD0_9BACT|nr:MAG: 50S ribosomal protein L4 [Candidatus Taylorbacteria bacterium RIFCSPHIGHO2_01_FULL_48_38]OHA27696.1 MAG: 50S ribosomal protein L4 [Candidatus Taylorbacteria bacterium RIFCSPHIGHO2_02_FULL_47_18]OHA35116.1 MAG: 50S ribosomal protein L4 [Candidatus Taylorbacteria bacterium RIFCSPLOWO2_01_FULL_48_100]OHA41028.1 MAG: 50S ribosomal protein L4 [Candidatus Taylorbacteria bacterium RIFCSPLOWO2_02_FULL_48_16]OHA44801.1 MAG: 50S ribosomal protein L4 [Candidatus Taylorbacteria bacterium RIFCSPLOWO
MESIIYNQKGEQSGKIALPKSVFGARWNADLVHQVVTSLLSSARRGTAHTKTRGEVSGGGKKPWKQKGTGRARHGSTRSPLWVGGGVTHGPRSDKNYARAVNSKMAARALASVLSQKLKDGEIVFVESLLFDAPKTARAKDTLTALAKAGFTHIVSKKQNAAFVGLAGSEPIAKKSFRNLGNISVGEWRNLNAAEVLRNKYLVFSEPEKAVKFFEEKLK